LLFEPRAFSISWIDLSLDAAAGMLKGRLISGED